MQRRLRTLVELAQAVGTSTIMLPCGRQGTEPRTELSRDIATVARTSRRPPNLSTPRDLAARGGPPLAATVRQRRAVRDALRRTGESPVGAVLDFSHVVASGDDEVDSVSRRGRIGHVHLRDAVLGDINLSIGRGQVNFPAAIEGPSTSGYQGHAAWRKPTTSKTPTGRPAGRAGRYITSLLRR